MTERGASGDRLYEAFVQDTNMYDPMSMWIEEGKALTVDVYDGDVPLGRVVVRVMSEHEAEHAGAALRVLAHVEPSPDKRPDADEQGRYEVPGPARAAETAEERRDGDDNARCGRDDVRPADGLPLRTGDRGDHRAGAVAGPDEDQG